MNSGAYIPRKATDVVVLANSLDKPFQANKNHRQKSSQHVRASVPVGPLAKHRRCVTVPILGLWPAFKAKRFPHGTRASAEV